MGTVKRLKDAQNRLQDAENAMPGAYENPYAEDIAGTLEKMDSQNSAGFDFTSANSAYKDAMARNNSNAAAGADAAAAVTDALSGGYGAAYAKSAADQAAAAQTANTGGTLAAARADALAQWQRELSGAGSKLGNLLGQDALERSEYDGAVSDAANWRNYLYDRTQQARQENSDFWGNVWNAVKGVASTAMQGYDAYMGYSAQKASAIQQAEQMYRDGNVDGAKAVLRMYRQDENMFDNLQGVSNVTVQQVAAMKDVYALVQSGAPEEMIQKYLGDYGLDVDMFKTWAGLSDTDKANLDYLMKAGDAAAGGNDALTRTILNAIGYGTDAVDDYSTIAGRVNQSNLNYYANQLALKKRYGTTSSSGTGSRKSSGSSGSKNSSGLTNSQLMTMANKFSSMKETNPLYGYYKQTLTDAGWLTDDSAGSDVAAQSGTGSRAAVTTTTSRLPTGQRTPWKTYGSASAADADAVAGASEKVGSAAGGDFDAAIAKAQSMANGGYSMSQIAEYLIRMGYSDNTISRVSNVMGW